MTTSDGKRVAAKQKIDGGPSVLYDAVAVLVSDAAVDALAHNAAAKDFVSDAMRTASSSPTWRRPCRCSRRPG